MTHKLGLHWLKYHQDRRDLEHIERIQYRSIKPFEWMWNNADFCRDLLAVLPQDAYILARDHPLSEQKEGVWSNPEAHGRSHADQWADKVRRGQYRLPVDRTFFLGVNEPDATHGDRDAIDRYTEAYLVRLQAHGLRGGAFNFSTGHPRTVDGTPNTLADYSVFERSHAAIVRGHHIAVAHIYGTGAVPLAPGNYDRLRACTWQDVEWVIGEFGIDEHVIGGGAHVGFHGHFAGRLGDYCGWLDTAIQGIEAIFPYIHSYQAYTFDYSHPWGTFDTRAIREALESYPWQHGQPKRQGGGDAHIPVVSKPGPTQPEEQPKMSIIEPRAAAAVLDVESGGEGFGADGRLKIRFETHIFKPRLANDALFARHFAQADSEPWAKPQYYRRGEGETWRPIHTGDQAAEWAAFDLARELHAEAAYQSISMGAAQIMGFNAQRVGYASALAMFRAFERSLGHQMIAFVNYILSDDDLYEAMLGHDWRTIARLYNGTGAVDHYARLLAERYAQLG